MPDRKTPDIRATLMGMPRVQYQSHRRMHVTMEFTHPTRGDGATPMPSNTEHLVSQTLFALLKQDPGIFGSNGITIEIDYEPSALHTPHSEVKKESGGAVGTSGWSTLTRKLVSMRGRACSRSISCFAPDVVIQEMETHLARSLDMYNRERSKSDIDHSNLAFIEGQVDKDLYMLHRARVVKACWSIFKWGATSLAALVVAGWSAVQLCRHFGWPHWC